MTMRLRQFALSPAFIWIFLLLIVITHIPTNQTQLMGDDYVQWAAVTLPANLYDKGLEIANPNNTFADKIKNMFLFLSADNGHTQQLKNYGAIPWWINDDITMHMFRPLSAVTHWIDYEYLGKSAFAMQWHSLLYILLLALTYFYFCKQFLSLAPPALHITGHNWIPALAVTLFIFSYNVPVNFAWLAARNAFITPIFVLLTLLAHHQWRYHNRTWFLPISLAFLLLALLAAEAGVAALGYIGAYALVLDKKPFWHRIWTVVPAILIVVLWRLLYSGNGFGAENIDLYVDPVRSPYAFITQRLPMLPIYYAKVVLGPLAVVWLTLTSNIAILAIISLLSCGLILWPLWSEIKTNKLVQFGLLGSITAIVPFLSTNPSPRSEPCLQIGFFLLLSIWLYRLSQRSTLSKGLKAFGVLVLLVHLVIPTLLVIGKHSRLLKIDLVEPDTYSMVEPAIAAGSGKRNLVIVNPPDYFAYYNRPFRWSFNDYALPNAILMLAPGLTAMTLARIDEHHYQLTSTEGFAVQSDTPRHVDTRPDPEFNRPRVLGYRANNQIMTKSGQTFSVQQHFSATGFDVEIKAVNDGIPTELMLNLHDPENAVWQWFDWSDHTYHQLTALAVGSSVHFMGPFDAGNGGLTERP